MCTHAAHELALRAYNQAYVRRQDYAHVGFCPEALEA